MGRYRLRQRREAIGLTQARLAKMADVLPAYVSLAERGKGSASDQQKIRYALFDLERKLRQDKRRERALARIHRYWLDLEPSLAADGLKRAILDRAWMLLERGEAEQADLLLEIVPEADARKFLDEYFGEGDEEPKVSHPIPVSLP